MISYTKLTEEMKFKYAVEQYILLRNGAVKTPESFLGFFVCLFALTPSIKNQKPPLLEDRYTTLWSRPERKTESCTRV